MLQDTDNNFIGELIFTKKSVNFVATKTNISIDSSTILQKVANADRTAFKDCSDTYGDLIWTLAKKFTASDAEAEKNVPEDKKLELEVKIAAGENAFEHGVTELRRASDVIRDTPFPPTLC